MGIIFPEDCEYVRVPQCTTGRVFLLKFKSSNKKSFFWMQEPKVDKDESYSRKVNEYLNNPPTPGSQTGRGSGNERDLQSLLSSMSQQQLMQLFGNVGGMSGLSSLMVSPEGVGRGSTSSRSRSSGATSGSTSQARSAASAATPAPALTPSSANVTGTLPTTPLTSGVPSLGNLTNLQQILSGIQIPDSALGGPAAGAEKPEKPSVDLSEGLSTEVLHPILSNADFMRQLRDFLPPSEGNDTAQMVRDTVQSPQFAQVMAFISFAILNISIELGALMFKKRKKILIKKK